MDMNINFITAKTRESFFAMALPMMAAMFLNMAYNIVDSIWIGNMLGESAMAALTSATPIVLILTSVGMGAANGLSILLSQRIGAGKNTESFITTSFLAAVVCSLLLTVLLEGGVTVILHWLNTPEEIMEMAVGYLRVYLLGYAAVFLYFYFTAILRSNGSTVLQAAAILFCTLLNAVLDPVFIHFIGFHGAAIATLISQSLAALFLIWFLFHKGMFSFRLASFDVRLVPELIKSAVPSILQQSLPAVSTGFLTALVSGFGIAAIAGYGIAGKLETILLYPAMAFNMVLTAIIGQCIGGRRPDRAEDYLKCACLWGGGIAAVLTVLVAAFVNSLSGVFAATSGGTAVVSEYFLIIGLGYVLNTITNCFVGTVNGYGKPAVGMLLMVFYYLAVRMPLAWALSQSAFGLKGIWLAVLISHIAACLAAGVVQRRLSRNSVLFLNNYSLTTGRTFFKKRSGSL